MSHTFTLVKTTLHHRVYKVNEETVIHDTRGVNISKQQLIDATLEAFRKPGSLSKQLSSGCYHGGVFLQKDKLSHYIMSSINEDLCVSATRPMTKEETRSITKAFLKEKPE